MFVREPNDGGDGWGVGDNDDFGDLHLRSGSPCINAGDSSIWPFPEGIVDMDGEPRIMGAVVDMGADEFFMPTVVVTKPEGGEVWTGGSLHEITWYSHLYEGPVGILFSQNAGSNWHVVEGSLPATGSYMWHLPAGVDSNQCMISVVPHPPRPRVVSFDSGLFTIHPDSIHPLVPARWESRGGDFTRSGLGEDYGPELGCLKWQFQTDGPVWASATVGASDRVHVACGDGKVCTLDLGDGSLVWSYDTNSELLSSPTIGPDGSVFVGSENGKLYAISIGGTLRWTHTTGGWIYSSPAVSDEGDVYVCSQDGTLYALGYDGSELWTFEPNEAGGIDAAIFASPAIGADGSVYIAGLYDANLYALDPNDGSVKWDCDFGSIGGAFASPVVAPDGTIYQTLLYDANLYAIDPNTGTILWSADMADPNSGWFDSDYVDTRDYVDGWYEPAVGPDGTIYVTFNDPYLRAVDADGNIMWVTRLGVTGSFSLAVGNDGLVYAAGEDGHLCAVDANGEELARFQGEELLSFPVIAADNTIVVSDANNRIWAIGGEGCEHEVSVLHRPEDLDGSRAANLLDFAILAMDWLDCSNTGIYSACDYEGDAIYLTGDINRNLYVEFEDVAVLAGRWLSED
jgi:outer membrane protein assembly factor BamB